MAGRSAELPGAWVAGAAAVQRARLAWRRRAVRADLPRRRARRTRRRTRLGRWVRRATSSGLPAAFSTEEEFEALKASTTPLRFPTPDGSVFIGDKGMMTTGTYGDVTRLIPVEKMKDYRMPPPLLTRSPGHMRDFIRACKGGDPACSNFDIASPFVEWMLLGVIALRHEGKLEYDPEKMRITNNVEANKLLKPNFRKGLGVPHRQGVTSSIRSRGGASLSRAAPRLIRQ